MYNLFVSGDGSAWNGDPFYLDAERCVSGREYTDKSIAEKFSDLSPESLEVLTGLPCIFAQETWNKNEPKFGFLTELTHRQGQVRIEYDLIDVSPFLKWEDLSKPPIFDLDISKLEMNRTHWAVKKVDLAKELKRRGIVIPEKPDSGTTSELVLDENANTILVNGKTFHYWPGRILGKPGYNGTVFQGVTEFGEQVAVKRLKLSLSSSPEERELNIVSGFVGHQFRNVIPIHACGRDETGNCFIVMPIAECSLQDSIAKSKFDEQQAKNILWEIANGLDEIHNVVHRDVKPQNVLLHHGKWKITDFGISKIVEAETATETHKRAMSPEYSAPERWNEETATVATDVYSLGCIAYALLTGAPPFTGPDRDDFKRQHTMEAPPNLTGITPAFSVLISKMLAKSTAARIGLESAIRTLASKESSAVTTKGLAMLSNAGLNVATETAAAETNVIAQKKKKKDRIKVSADAYSQLDVIAKQLCGVFQLKAPNVNLEVDLDSICTYTLSLGIASLLIEFEPGHIHPENQFPQSGWDVFASGMISVIQEEPKYEWRSSLWFTDCGDSGVELAWHECSYFSPPAIASPQTYEPFAMSLEPNKADGAASNFLSTTRIAFGPQVLSVETIEAFHDRWAVLFARAANGKLTRPPMLPVPSGYFS